MPLPRPEAVTTKPRRGHNEGSLQVRTETKAQGAAGRSQANSPIHQGKAAALRHPASKVLEDNTPPPQNAVPYGQGGSPAVPYSQFSARARPEHGGADHGRHGFQRPGGGGDFGGRFPWYVDAVRNRVSSNWLQTTVDPQLRGRRAPW